MLVVNKPSGLATLPGSWEAGSLSLQKELEPEHGHLWPVHRLDKISSGLVIFARNAESHRELSMLFEHHKVRKTYHALIVGSPTWDEHTARHHLRVSVGHSHRTIVDNSTGKPSETCFTVLERLHGHTLLAAIPTTGRTHQIRAHASALGFPLLADSLYGAPLTSVIDRPALHACSLEFTLQDRPFAFTAPYPLDFATALSVLRTGV